MYGLYYKLNNGEEIKIDIEVTETYEKKLIISLFNGSTYFEYDYNNMDKTLNEIIEEIETNYKKYEEEDQDHFYRCNGFYD